MPISDSYYRGMQVIVDNSDIPELPDGNTTVYGVDISNNAIKVSEFTPLTPGSGQTSKIRFIDLTKARYSAENGALIASDSKNLPVHYSSIIA